MINTSYEGICVEIERKKQHNIGFPTFQMPVSAKNCFMTVQFNINFDDFRYLITYNKCVNVLF